MLYHNILNYFFKTFKMNAKIQYSHITDSSLTKVPCQRKTNGFQLADMPNPLKITKRWYVKKISSKYEYNGQRKHFHNIEHKDGKPKFSLNRVNINNETDEYKYTSMQMVNDNDYGIVICHQCQLILPGELNGDRCDKGLTNNTLDKIIHYISYQTR